MQELTKIPPNVWEMLEKTSAAIGRIESQRFSQEMHSRIVDREMTSPIEQIFVIALEAMCRSHYVDLDPEPWFGPDGAARVGYGLHSQYQAKVGKYRVDFLLEMNDSLIEPKPKAIAVELDGHAFHDRDKHQRSYEKARDRFLQRSGLTVLHFTGSDVVSDPLRVVHEVMATAGCFGGEDSTYSPTDPYGLD